MMKVLENIPWYVQCKDITFLIRAELHSLN